MAACGACRRRTSTALAAEGIRLDNFNVEFSCTVSRAALLTGRYAIRTGRRTTHGDHAMGSHDRRGAQVRGLRDGAVWEVAPRRDSTGEQGAAHRSGLRRVVRHPDHEQRGADDDHAGLRPGQDRIAVHLGGEGGRALAQGEGVRSRDAAHGRSRGRAQERRLHGTQREREQTVLSRTIRSRRSISRRCRIRTSPARPARATSATRWRTWITTLASCWTRSSGSAIERNTTRVLVHRQWRRSRAGRGAAHQARGVAFTTR